MVNDVVQKPAVGCPKTQTLVKKDHFICPMCGLQVALLVKSSHLLSLECQLLNHERTKDATLLRTIPDEEASQSETVVEEEDRDEIQTCFSFFRSASRMHRLVDSIKRCPRT